MSTSGGRERCGAALTDVGEDRVVPSQALNAVRDEIAKGALSDVLVDDWVDVDQNSVAVTVQGPALAAEALLRGRPPRGPSVRVVAGDRLRGQKTLGRYNDSPPHWNSIHIINNTTGGGCTGGFVVFDLNPVAYGHRYQLTSGHCGSPGQTYRNDNGSSAGVVGYYSYSWGGTDSSLLDGPYWGTNNTVYTYVGTASSSSTYSRISSVSTPVYICGDGSVTGLTPCNSPNNYVISRNVCHTYPSPALRTCNLTQAGGANVLWQGGDSGGPVITNNGPSYSAVGIIDGVDSSGFYYYTPLPYLLSFWNVALA